METQALFKVTSRSRSYQCHLKIKVMMNTKSKTKVMIQYDLVLHVKDQTASEADEPLHFMTINHKTL